MRSFLAVLKTGSYPGQILGSKLGIGPQSLVLILASTALAILALGAYFFRILLKKGWFEKVLNRDGRGMDIMAFAVMAVLLIASVISRGYSIKKQIVLFMPYGMLLVGLILPSYSSFLFEYYSRGILPSEGINLDSYEHEIAALRSEPRRIWLVSNQESFIDPEGKIRKALGQVVEPTKSICYYRVRVDLFEPKR